MGDVLSSEKSHELYQLARGYLASGVSASTRVNTALGRPFFVSRGDGSRVYDLDGREYIDMCTSHGATILGHNNLQIKEAIAKALEMGIVCSYETEHQSKLARKLVDMVPALESVRFTCSGTEATMHAIRLAREYTGKNKIIKFEGHFHGYHDYVQFSWSPPLDEAGPAESPLPFAQSGGIPPQMKDLIIVLPFNNLDVLEKALTKHRDDVAAVILEPVNYNCGCIVPDRAYIAAMRELTRENDILLIFDEVLSAFRMGRGCAQEYLGVTPDLCTVGKCVAGGTPLSVFGGKKDIMAHLRPAGNSEHSGTYTGHLIPVMAANACLEVIDSGGFYDHIYRLADRLYSGLAEIIKSSGVVARVQGLGARFGIYFGIDEEVTNYRTAARNDRDKTLKFFLAAARRGVYFHDYGGKACHHGFSYAHTLEDIDLVLDRLEGAMKELTS